MRGERPVIVGNARGYRQPSLAQIAKTTKSGIAGLPQCHGYSVATKHDPCLRAVSTKFRHALMSRVQTSPTGSGLQLDARKKPICEVCVPDRRWLFGGTRGRRLVGAGWAGTVHVALDPLPLFSRSACTMASRISGLRARCAAPSASVRCVYGRRIRRTESRRQLQATTEAHDHVLCFRSPANCSARALDAVVHSIEEIETHLRRGIMPVTDNEDALIRLGFQRAYPQIRSGYEAVVWERSIDLDRRSRHGFLVMARQRAMLRGQSAGAGDTNHARSTVPAAR